MDFYKRGKKGHIKKDRRSKINGYGGKSPNKSVNKLPEWVTNKPVVAYTKELAIATMTRNNNKYK